MAKSIELNSVDKTEDYEEKPKKKKAKKGDKGSITRKVISILKAKGPETEEL